MRSNAGMANRQGDLGPPVRTLAWWLGIMDYVFPAWKSAVRIHVRRLQVLQSLFFRLATGAPWYKEHAYA